MTRHRGPHRPHTSEEGEKVWRVASARPDFVGPSYRLGVPAKLARMIGPDRTFAIEVTDEGILYRYVDGDGPPPPEVPAWLR